MLAASLGSFNPWMCGAATGAITGAVIVLGARAITDVPAAVIAFVERKILNDIRIPPFVTSINSVQALSTSKDSDRVFHL